MTADYSGVDLKIERADEHLRAFESELRVYVEANPITLEAKSDPDPSRERFHIGPRNPLPPRLSLILGDCIHNLRSALDHLVMALALDNGADPDDNSIQFPICTEAAFFHGGQTRSGKTVGPRGRNQVRALRPAAQAFIEGLQPYNRGSNAWMLTELGHLDNVDKHRQLIEHTVEASALFRQPGVQVEWMLPMELEAGAHIATVVYPTGYTGVKVQPFFTAGITVKRSNGIGFTEAQPFVREQVLPYIRRDIVDEARRLFPPT